MHIFWTQLTTTTTPTRTRTHARSEFQNNRMRSRAIAHKSSSCCLCALERRRHFCTHSRLYVCDFVRARCSTACGCGDWRFAIAICIQMMAYSCAPHQLRAMYNMYTHTYFWAHGGAGYFYTKRHDKSRAQSHTHTQYTTPRYDRKKVRYTKTLRAA